MKYGNEINVGPGVEALPPKGHARNEVLKKRSANLDAIADGLINSTDAPVYSVSPEAIKEEPEILKHFDFAAAMFTVSNPVAGKVYFWCRDERTAIAQKQAEARMWLGVGAKGWEIVGNCSCANEKHDESCVYPECQELKAADGRRIIGDTCLMRLDYDEYVKIHKRMLLVVQYRDNNFSESLSDFVSRHEGLVSVVSGQGDPRDLYTAQYGNKLVRAGIDERGRGITKGR